MEELVDSIEPQPRRELSVPQLHTSRLDRRREMYDSRFDTNAADLRREAWCDSLRYSHQSYLR
jgi:hypothetical protein